MNSKINVIGLFLFFAATATVFSQSLGKDCASDWSNVEVLQKDAEIDYPIVLSEAEWRERLGSFEYHVLREKGTERAFTGKLDKEYAEGTYYSAATGQPLFSSESKFNSGTGWPSFYQPIDDKAVGTSVDKSFFMVRTEVHCSNCGGHLGHIFDDGPKPTGLRHCINGVALKFEPKEGA